MVRTSILLLACTAAVYGQLMSGTTTFDNGSSFTYETRLEPASPALEQFGGGTLTEKGVAKRHLTDRQRKAYFGYDLRMEPAGNGEFRVSFSPLSIGPAQMEKIFPEVHGWTMIPLPGQPAPQTVRAGDKIELVMFENPSTGQKIVDYITVGGTPGRVIKASGPSRDFSMERDLWLDVYGPKLVVNGKPFDAFARSIGGLSGSPLSLYIPRYGRFVFSLAPGAEYGLRKAGEVRGNTMSWRWGPDDFVLSSDRRIAPGTGAYNLYVFQDLRYRPKGGDVLELSAGGTLQHLTR